MKHAVSSQTQTDIHTDRQTGPRGAIKGLEVMRTGGRTTDGLVLTDWPELT